MTECSNIEMRDWLPDLVNESLEPSVRVLVVAHVGECAACEAEVAIIRSVRLLVVEATPRVNVASIVNALPRSGAGPAVVTSIADAPSLRKRSPGSWRAAAAILVLAAGVGSYALLEPDRPAGLSDSIALSDFSTDSSAGMALTGALADLSDAELVALIEDLGAIEALPSTDVEMPAGISIPLLSTDSTIQDLETY